MSGDEEEQLECAVCGSPCVEENYTQDCYPACSPSCAIHHVCEFCGTFVVGICQLCGDPTEEEEP